VFCRMDHFILFFKEHGLTLRRSGFRWFYPGSCDQCHMKNRGSKTILLKLTPGYLILICDECHRSLKTTFEGCLDHLKNASRFHLLDRSLRYRVIDQSGQLQEGYKIDGRYSFYMIHDKLILVPMIHATTQKEILMPMREICILNDVNFLG